MRWHYTYKCCNFSNLLAVCLHFEYWSSQWCIWLEESGPASTIQVTTRVLTSTWQFISIYKATSSLTELLSVVTLTMECIILVKHNLYLKELIFLITGQTSMHLLRIIIFSWANIRTQISRTKSSDVTIEPTLLDVFFCFCLNLHFFFLICKLLIFLHVKNSFFSLLGNWNNFAILISSFTMLETNGFVFWNKHFGLKNPKILWIELGTLDRLQHFIMPLIIWIFGKILI